MKSLYLLSTGFGLRRTIFCLMLVASLGDYGLQAGSSPRISSNTEEGKIYKTSVAAPGQSERLSQIKELIRQDLNAVRRARYALKRAQKKQNPQAEKAAEEQLRAAKDKLKKDRMALRELWSAQQSGKQSAKPKRNQAQTQNSTSQQPELVDSVADKSSKPEEKPAWLQPAKDLRQNFP
jgi:acyl-CoA reductase-like NAD-dependent aldehyde dehydrogenase